MYDAALTATGLGEVMNPLVVSKTVLTVRTCAQVPSVVF
jgi:hypothetical protein